MIVNWPLLGDSAGLLHFGLQRTRGTCRSHAEREEITRLVEGEDVRPFSAEIASAGTYPSTGCSCPDGE